MSTQALPHDTRPPAQEVEHWPLKHDSPAAQGLAQAPQLAASEERSTHWPAQGRRPAGQVRLQVPALQTRSLLQWFTQLPQWVESPVRSWQALPQRDSPSWHSQAPSRHSSPGMQETPHFPQLTASLVGSTQLPPQLSFPAGHGLGVVTVAEQARHRQAMARQNHVSRIDLAPNFPAVPWAHLDYL